MRAFAFAFLVVTTPALAQDVRVAVTPLDGLGVEGTLLSRLDRALARELQTLEIVTIDPELVRAQKPCDGEVKCLTELGRLVGATRVLAGSVGLAGDELNIALKVIDVGPGTEARSIDEAAPIDQAEVRVRATATKLLAPAKYNKSGSVIVSVPVEGADVVVDGQSRGTTPLFGPIDGLPPGRREVEVRYAGAKSWRGFVDLRFGEPHRVDLDVVDGVLVEVTRNAPKVASAGPVRAEGEPDFLLFTGLGSVVIGVGAGVTAIVAYSAAVDSKQRIDNGEITRENVDANKAAAYLYGTMAIVSVAALAVGGGLIAFSLVE